MSNVQEFLLLGFQNKYVDTSRLCLTIITGDYNIEHRKHKVSRIICSVRFDDHVKL